MIPAIALAGILASQGQATGPVMQDPEPCARALRARDLAREVDALGDIRASSRQIARMRSDIVDVRLDAARVHASVEIRPSAGASIEMVGRDASGMHAPLGAVAWDGAVLSLRWNRVGARRMSVALLAADMVLRTARMEVRMADGSACTLSVPTEELVLGVRPGATARVRIRDAAGLPLDAAAADGCGWRLSPEPAAGARELASDEATLRIAYDPGMARLSVSWPDPQLAERARLRSRLAELRGELGRRTEEERPLVAAEIAQVERDLRDAGSMARPAKFVRPAIVEIRDGAGRPCARVTIEAR